MSRRLRLILALAALSAAGSPAWAQPHQHRQQGQERAMGRQCGMMGMARDSATRAQMQVIHQLVMNHDRITRTVTNLPDGIRTITESEDPELTQLIQGHVVLMFERVRTGDDPGCPMESPAVRLLFREHEKIKTSVKPTPKGIRIEQRSSDSAVVAALQQHAAEVSDLVARGRAAMHQAMMRDGCGMRPDSAGPAR